MKNERFTSLLVVVCCLATSTKADSYSIKGSSVTENSKPVATATNTESESLDDITKVSTSVDYDAPHFSVSTSNQDGQRILNIVGRGIKDEIQFKSTEKVMITLANQAIVVHGKVFSSVPNSLFVVDIDGCHERTFSQGRVISTVQLTKKDCSKIKKAMKEIEKEDFTDYPSYDELTTFERGVYVNRKGDIKGTDYDSSLFTVLRIGNTISILGNGIKDEFTFTGTETKDIYNAGNILAIGDKYYSDKPSSMIVLLNDHCQERLYKKGKLKSVKNLTTVQCDFMKKKIAAFREQIDGNLTQSLSN